MTKDMTGIQQQTQFFFSIIITYESNPLSIGVNFLY